MFPLPTSSSQFPVCSHRSNRFSSLETSSIFVECNAGIHAVKMISYDVGAFDSVELENLFPAKETEFISQSSRDVAYLTNIYPFYGTGTAILTHVPLAPF
jgi:hypothetical protein